MNSYDDLISTVCMRLVADLSRRGIRPVPTDAVAANVARLLFPEVIEPEFGKRVAEIREIVELHVAVVDTIENSTA